jgi:hypothetical protein
MKRFLPLLPVVALVALVWMIWSPGAADDSLSLDPSNNLAAQERGEDRKAAPEPSESLDAVTPDQGGERQTMTKGEVPWRAGRLQWPEGAREPVGELAVLAIPREMSYQRFLRWIDNSRNPPASYPVDGDGSFRVPSDSESESTWVIVRGRFLYSPQATDLGAGDDQPIALLRGAYLHGRVQSKVQGAFEEPLRLELAPTDVQLDPMSMLASTALDTVHFDADAQGVFTFRALPAGHDYTLRAVHPFLTSERVALGKVTAGAELEAVLSLVEGGRVAGVVVDEGGLPVAQATVRVESGGLLGSLGVDAEREAISDVEGHFLLRGLGSGEARLRARAAGFLESEIQTVEVREKGIVDHVILTLSRGESISGNLHWNDGRPAGEIEVQAIFDVAHALGLGGLNALRGARAETITDARGRFTLTGLGKGPFVVSANPDAPLFAPASAAADPIEVRWQAQASGVQPGTQGLALTLEPPLAIAGRVVDESGAPVEEFRVYYAPHSSGPAGGLSSKMSLRSRTFESDAGQFVLEDFSVGSYLAWVQDDAHASEAPIPFEAPLTEVLVLRVRATARVSGGVFGTDGAPIPGAVVRTGHGTSLEDMLAVGLEAVQTTADERGHFDLQGIPAGSTQLIAEAEGWARSPGVGVELAPGDVREGVRIEVPRGGTLTGEVYDSAGKPASGFMVTTMALDSITSGAGLSRKMGNTDAAGAFRFEHLQAGTWQVTAMDTARALDAQADMGTMISSVKIGQADIREGETTHVVLGAPPEDPVRVFGTVTLGGEPFAGAFLSLFPDGGQLYANLVMTAVGDDGHYELTLDGPGGYSANLQTIGTGPGQQSTIEYRLEVPAGAEYRHDFELPLGRISGRIVGPDGRGVSGERVTVTLDSDARSDRMFGGQYSELVSGEGGAFEVLPLRPGIYRVSAGGAPMMGMGAGHLGRVTLGGLVLGEDQTLDNVVLELPEPGALRLTVLAPDGTGTAGATVFVRDDTGRILEPFSMQTTGADGTVLLKALAPGEYTLLARTRDLCSAESAPLGVRVGEVTDLDLRLDIGTIVKVQLQSKTTREPVRGSVRLLDAAGRDYANLFGYQDLQDLYIKGRFSPTEHRFGPLPPGRYVVHGQAGEDSAKKPVTLKGGERRVVLRLK